ncbi:MAG: DUF2520 domain-containing protein [Lysobacterales bacterium]
MTQYAIVGGGRLACHFSEYFRLLEIFHTGWARDLRSPLNTFGLTDPKQRLKAAVGESDRVLLLVPDNGIVEVLSKYPFLHEKQLIHCSGSLAIPGVAGAHPLMTFPQRLYPLETYKRIPFVLEAGSGFDHLFPDLPNPHFVIDAGDKDRYHAMCVMAGNFTQLLWQGITERFEQQFELPAAALHPYLKQVVENFVEAPDSALTGPLTRDDHETVERNFNSLAGDHLQALYAAFIHFHEQGKGRATGPERARLEKVI